MLDNVLDAGLWIVPLILASVAMIGFVVYNFIELNQNKFNPVELKAGLLDHMQNVRVRSAIEMASGHPSYLGRMVAASLPQFDATNTEDFGREDVDDAVAELTRRVERDEILDLGKGSAHDIEQKGIIRQLKRINLGINLGFHEGNLKRKLVISTNIEAG